MKLRDLINHLSVFDENLEVCIFDHLTNSEHFEEDSSGEGIYQSFSVEIIEHDEEDKEKNFIALIFDNDHVKPFLIN